MVEPCETPCGFLKNASEFYLAADFLLKKTNGEVSLPAYYLLGLALELSLKAYLLHCGISAKDLSNQTKFGHDLCKLLDGAIERKLSSVISFSKQEQAVICLLSVDYNKKRRFTYRITQGIYTLPLINVLDKVACDLIKQLHNVCCSELIQ